MTTNLSAFDTIKNEYDIDTLRDISKYGCESGGAYNHIYYKQTVSFFDKHEDEILEYLDDNYGSESTEHIWNNNPNNITGYKNDLVWAYINSVSHTLVDQYEDITCEEMNDSFDEILNSNWGVNHLEVVNI